MSTAATSLVSFRHDDRSNPFGKTLSTSLWMLYHDSIIQESLQLDLTLSTERQKKFLYDCESVINPRPPMKSSRQGESTYTSAFARFLTSGFKNKWKWCVNKQNRHHTIEISSSNSPVWWSWFGRRPSINTAGSDPLQTRTKRWCATQPP